MLIKFTAAVATLFFSGTVVWACLPVPSPQPVSLAIPTSAGMQVQVDPIEYCQDVCDALFVLAVQNSNGHYIVCNTNAMTTATNAVVSCNLILDAGARQDCMDAARLKLFEDLDVCAEERDGNDLAAIAAWEACMEACFA